MPPGADYERGVGDACAAMALEAGDGAEAVASSCLPDSAVTPLQTHTCRVRWTDGSEEAGALADTDGLLTCVRGLWIGVRTADCVPLVLHAPDIGAVGAVHAGWRGTLGGIAGEAVRLLLGRGADPARIHAAFGPCICGDCYEVSPELADDFRRAGLGESVSGMRGARPHIDLVASNRTILTRCGVSPGNIAPPAACTYGSGGVWPSWRRDNGTARRLFTCIRLL